MSKAVYTGLEPAGLWQHFEAINRIPRPSKHERRMTEYIQAWAQKHRFAAKQDGAGNLCVYVPASPGREHASKVVLQGHLDMVCERNSDSPYDPEKGTIHVIRDGEWIHAEGTTLGADNGIGVAAMLHVAENSDVQHGPLELLFTVDEETGLTGASQLDPTLIRGRVLLNLDSEDDGELCVGCAGSCDVDLRWKAERQDTPQGHAGQMVSVGGLRGGHSGMDIDKNRLNAIRAGVRLLQEAQKSVQLHLVSVEGGNKRNAIPRECRFTVFYAGAQDEAFREAVKAGQAALERQYQGLEAGLVVQLRLCRHSCALGINKLD